MANIFKEPWTWLLVFFLVTVTGIGMSLFYGKSTKIVEQGVVGANDYSPVLSQDVSEEIVRQLEAGNGVSGEEGGQNDQLPITNDQLGAENEQGAENNPARIATRSVAGGEQGAMNNEQQTTDNGQLTTKEGQVGGEVMSNGEDQTVNSQKAADVVNRLVSWGFAEASEREIDTVVIHSTYNATGGDPFSVSKILDIYKSYDVAPHYLIARDGTVYQLVEEKNIAYHAGESEMPDGRKNVNDFSIGIELIGKDGGSPSDEQYASLEKLLADIKDRNDITHIVGHSDIAPGRKTDPWGFEWKRIQ